MISIIGLILEMSVKPKDPYATGTQHSVYKSEKDPTKLFKVVNPGFDKVPEQEYDWIKVFKSNPALFPIVYRHNDQGAEVEKLDWAKAAKDYEELDQAINAKFGKTYFRSLLQDIVENESSYKTKVKEVGEYLTQEDQRLAAAYKRFVTLMVKLQPINQVDSTIDVHAGNFGYDKQGKLKMLDI